MGLLYGLVHTVSPDHLGTLMTLSAVTSSQSAFKAGAAWGLGHSFGTVIVAGICIALHHFVKFDMELWEHFGNYIIGVSMVLCGLYFILREDSFLKEEADGTVVPQPCACQGHAVTGPRAQPRVCRPVHHRRAEKSGKFCASFCTTSCCDDCESVHEVEVPPPPLETDPLLPVPEASAQAKVAEQEGRGWKGAMLGVCQGICCPVGMVGVTFLASLPAQGVVAFLIIVMTLVPSGTATLAAGWAFFTSKGLARNVSTRTLYRASCGFTLSLGVSWLVANCLGGISKLDYTEGLAD